MMGVPSEFITRTVGLVKKIGSIAAELEAIHGPFRLFALFSRSSHVPNGGWFLIASAEWIDGDLGAARIYLWDFIKQRVGSDYSYLQAVDVKIETESPVFQIQQKLGWVILENGIAGDLGVEWPALWMVYRCLPNGDEFAQAVGLEAGRSDSTRSNELREQLDLSVVPFEVQEKIIGMVRPSGWYGEGSGEISREACWASIDFISRAKKAITGLDNPRIGPSPTGAVALQWDFDDVSFIVRISSGKPGNIHFQEEGPDFQQEEGVAPREDVLARLGKIVQSHVLA
jgi:hypothetical protein